MRGDEGMADGRRCEASEEMVGYCCVMVVVMVMVFCSVPHLIGVAFCVGRWDGGDSASRHPYNTLQQLKLAGRGSSLFYPFPAG